MNLTYAYLFLAFAIILEITGTSFVRDTQGFTKWIPSIICLISISLGSLGFFIISKYILSKFFKKYYDKYVNKINFTIKDSKLEYLIVFRLIPGPPFNVHMTLSCCLFGKRKKIIDQMKVNLLNSEGESLAEVGHSLACGSTL